MCNAVEAGHRRDQKVSLVVKDNPDQRGHPHGATDARVSAGFQACVVK